MKNQLLKLMFIVVCLGFMSSGCEKENNEPLLVQDQALTPTIVSLKEIPDIEKFLNDNIFGFQNREFDERSAIYDESNIIKLIDKEGNHNYSISFMYEDTPITTFHNLIIYKPIVGKINSHVVRYESNQLDQETFLAKKLDFNYYIGTAYIEGVNSVDSRGENPAGRDVNTPCPETVITFGGIGTGTGPNTNNGTVINSNASVTSTSSPFGGSYSYSPTGGGGSFSIGGFYFYTVKAPKIHRPSGRSINDKCPEVLPPGYVNINMSQVALNNLKTALSLTNPQWRWFTQAGNEDKFEPFYLAYMSDLTKNMPETKAFFKNSLVRMIAEPEVFTSVVPFIIEKKINDTALDPCAKNVLTQLKNTSVCDIAQVLAKLDADASDYNTIIRSEVPPDGSPAQTIRNSSFNYTIFISTNYTGKTKLYIANLLIHEMVHAYFLSIVDDYKSNPNNNQFLYDLNSFPSLFQAYCDKKFPPALGTSQNIHHLEMANYYVDAISRALQEYQTGISVPTNSIPNQIYTDLAWGGLNSTPVFEATYPIENPNRERILNRYAAEQTGNTIGAGTTNSQTPISQPCN